MLTGTVLSNVVVSNAVSCILCDT